MSKLLLMIFISLIFFSCSIDRKKRIKGSYYLLRADHITISYLQNEIYDHVTDYDIENYNFIHDSIIIAHKGSRHFIINANHPPKNPFSYKNKIPLIGKAYTDSLKKLDITLDDLKDPLPAKMGLF